jgi:hypothetical protein
MAVARSFEPRGTLAGGEKLCLAYLRISRSRSCFLLDALPLKPLTPSSPLGNALFQGGRAILHGVISSLPVFLGSSNGILQSYGVDTPNRLWTQG